MVTLYVEGGSIDQPDVPRATAYCLMEKSYREDRISLANRVILKVRNEPLKE